MINLFRQHSSFEVQYKKMCESPEVPVAFYSHPYGATFHYTIRSDSNSAQFDEMSHETRQHRVYNSISTLHHLSKNMFSHRVRGSRTRGYAGSCSRFQGDKFELGNYQI